MEVGIPVSHWLRGLSQNGEFQASENQQGGESLKNVSGGYLLHMCACTCINTHIYTHTHPDTDTPTQRHIYTHINMTCKHMYTHAYKYTHSMINFPVYVLSSKKWEVLY